LILQFILIMNHSTLIQFLLPAQSISFLYWNAKIQQLKKIIFQDLLISLLEILNLFSFSFRFRV
jgi:hypothetical protein